MEEYLIWKILGIEETSDADEIKGAYRKKLSMVNPEGFMRLREAYEQALSIISQKEQETEVSEDDELLALKNGDAYDQFFYEINMIYRDFGRRVKPEEWEKAFSLDICATAEIDDTIPERLLAFFMDHYYLPTEVWRCVDSKFHYVDNIEDWRDRFPENYLNFVRYKVVQGEFLDFDCLSGDLSENVDDFLHKYMDLKDIVDKVGETGLDSFEQSYKEIKLYDIEYPHVEVEYMRYLYEQDMENENPPCKQVVDMAEDLYSKYGDIAYIEYYCGMIFEKSDKLELAEKIYKHLLEEQPSHYRANIGMACILEKRGEYKEAKEILLELLEKDESIIELHEMCDRINGKLIKELQEKLDAKEEPGKNAMELAWCYFQLHDFDKTLETLQLLPEEEYDNYDYVNLKGRNYLAMDKYDEALPYLLKWQEILKDTVDDGTKENARRLRRVAFSYFAIGLCQWYVADREVAISNLNKGVELEEAFYIRLSYMDEIARLYLEIKEWEKAIEFCNKIIELDRGYYPAYVKRQECYFELKDGQGVIDDFFESTNIYPGYVKPYVYAIKIFFFYEQYEDVQRVYDQAKEHNLESDEMELYYIKMLCMTKGEPEQLKEHLERVNALKASYYKKKSQNQESDLDESELISESVLIHWDLKDYDKAISECERALKNDPYCLRLLKLLGDIYADRKMYQEAISKYERYIKNNEKNEAVYLSLGKCHWRLSHINEALKNLEKSYELYPDSDELMWYMARVYSEKYKNEHNIADYDKAIHFASVRINNEESAFNYNERGIIREGANDLEGALEDYLKAAELDPENVYAQNNVADMYRMLRKDEPALSYMEKAIALKYEEENVWVYSNMAKLYEYKGEFEKACEYTIKQLELKPDSPSLLKQLARQYKGARKYKAAIEVYKKLYKLEGISESEMLCEIGDCFADMNKTMIAKGYYNKAISTAKSKIKKEDNKNNWESLFYAVEYLAIFQKNIKEQFNESIKYYEQCMDIAKEHVPDKLRYINEILAEIYYECGETQKAALYAKNYIECLCKEFGDVDSYLNDRRYLRVRAVDITCCYMIMGEMELANKYLKLASEGYLCCHCNHKDCFEAYFLQGMFKELKGDIEGAVLLYKKSLEINPNYKKCERALKRLGCR